MRALRELLGGERAQIARHDRAFGNDVVLAERRSARLHRVELGLRAPDHERGIERQVRLPGQRLAKGVEDSRGLEDRAVADVGAEDLRRVRRLAGDRQGPGRRPATADDGAPRIAGAVLEADGDIDAFRRLDERRARHVLRVAGRFFVAGHDDGHVHAVERSGGAAAPSSVWTMMTSPPFMSMMPGPRRLTVVEPLELLERTVGLEHGVEMANEENPPPRPRTVGDEVSRAIERRPVDPPRREPQRLELGGEELADLANAGMVLRPAVDVDRAFEQRQRLGIVRVHVGDDGALVGGQGRDGWPLHG